ncbi:MAG: FAD-dependent monooxygenase [Alphaproteobacteria bacterium]|jgi:2-polyprenyl-6-methoxyphenol hydroxylase-like FAD-dependent oxidoreductase|nr:FAD-dependent monooxygenase [Alphaproteobacteria bacterium]
MRALVVGGGIAGLSAAIALAMRGAAVDLVEVKPQNAVLGVGIIQPNNALRVLDQLGILEPCLAAGYPTEGWVYYDHRGIELTRFDSLRLVGDHRPPNNALPRPALHAILTERAASLGVHIALGTTVAGLAEDDAGVDVALSDGRRQRYDLIVGADGIRSALRRRLFGDGHDPQFVGHSCWRVTVPRPADLDRCALFFGIGLKAGMVPLTRAEMYLLLISNEPSPAHVDLPEQRRMLAGYLSHFGGPVAQAAAMIGPETPIVYTPVEEVILPAPWGRGRIWLIGDAAHASTPYLSQGATMAMEDAVVLAELAAAPDFVPAAALDAFMARRLPRCRFVQETSRRIGDEGQLTDPAACAARNERIRSAEPGRPRPHETFLAEPV